MNAKLAILTVAASFFHLVGCAAPAAESEPVEVEAATDVETQAVPSIIANDPSLTLAGTLEVCPEGTKSSSESLFAINATTGANCALREYNRGNGVPMQCADGLIQSGAICYRPCRTGYTMVAGVCWQSSCPSGMQDIGALCAKPAPYGRGAGYALWQRERCEDRHGSCEKYGLMWYPKCDEGYHNVGSNICSPDCPSGMTDTGAFCQKKTYVQNSSNTTPISYRAWPELDTPVFTAPLDTCRGEKSDRSGELCFEPCLPGWKGSVNVCTYSGK